MPSLTPHSFRCTLQLACWAAAMTVAEAAPPATPTGERPRRTVTRFEERMVDISIACPGIVVELRYATARNITGKPIYPPGSRALLRKSVAERLNRAQAFVRERGFGLKVWDAYRPAWVQKVLWDAVRNPAYVVQPSSTGSLHNWGAAVDVTLVDLVRGREARMPTDFDAFSEAARYDYRGNDPEIFFNLSTLKQAMAKAGFRHIRDEWWHYSVGNVPFGPIEVPLVDPSKELAKPDAEPAKPAEPEAAAPAKKQPRGGRRIFSTRTGKTL